MTEGGDDWPSLSNTPGIDPKFLSCSLLPEKHPYHPPIFILEDGLNSSKATRDGEGGGLGETRDPCMPIFINDFINTKRM